MLVVIPSNDSKSSHLVFVIRMLYTIIVFFFHLLKAMCTFPHPTSNMSLSKDLPKAVGTFLHPTSHIYSLCLKTSLKPWVSISSFNKQHSLCLKAFSKPWVLSSSNNQHSLCLKTCSKAVGTFFHLVVLSRG